MKTLTTHTSKGVLTPSTNSSNISSSHWTNCCFDLSILIIYKNNIISVLRTQMSKNKLPTNKIPHYTQTGSPSRCTWIVLNHWFFNFECRVNPNTCRICVDVKIADSETLIMAVFSRAVFQVAQRVTSGSPVKTVVFSTRLKLSESANFNGILIKFKPLNQVA